MFLVMRSTKLVGKNIRRAIFKAAEGGVLREYKGSFLLCSWKGCNERGVAECREYVNKKNCRTKICGRPLCGHHKEFGGCPNHAQVKL